MATIIIVVAIIIIVIVIIVVAIIIIGIVIIVDFATIITSCKRHLGRTFYIDGLCNKRVNVCSDISIILVL